MTPTSTLEKTALTPSLGATTPGTLQAAAYRGVSTQNSLPSGSAITTQLTSPWPMSIRVAPRETRRSTSAC